MKIYSSLWNADDWATQGGRVKADWTKAPFVASYRNFTTNACVVSSSSSSCTSSRNGNDGLQNGAWLTQGLDAAGRNRLRWVHSKYLVYNNCTNFKRFPEGLPIECKQSRFL
ncbi:Xyloglucan endotransglucosylase protein 1 [Linum perenne]